MTKQDYYRQSGMATREYRPYQTDTFPLSVHKTIFRLDSTLPQGARCNVLYAHWHEEVDIFYLEKGSCVYCVAGHEYHLQAGDAVWTPPRLAHWAYTTQREGEVVSMAWCSSRRFWSFRSTMWSTRSMSCRC